MKNNFGHTRRWERVYKKVAGCLAKVEEEIKHIAGAHAELERAIKILDEAALLEARSQRVQDYLKRKKVSNGKKRKT